MTKLFRLSLLVSFWLVPQLAFAHSPIKGMGDFFNGVIHPLLVPAQVLMILALGLLYGQHQPNKHKTAILLFLAASIAGLVLTLFNVNIKIETILLIGASLTGLLVLSGITLHWFVFIALGILAGLIIGLDSSQQTLSGKARIVSLFGSGVGIYFLLLYAMAISESLSKKLWQTVMVRVVASWVSASALMVLALTLSRKL